MEELIQSLPYVDVDGERRFLGNLPTPEGLMKSIPLWHEVEGNELIPESEWDTFEEQLPTGFEVKDQNSVGACNGHAAASSLELERWVEGYAHVPLSAWWVYGNLATWPFDTGSNIGSALELLQAIGCAPESTVPYKMWRKAAFSAEAAKAAPRFKITIGERVTTDEAFASNILRRRPMNFAICAGARLNNLDADGVSPLGIGMCNHAVTCWGGLKKSKKGVWLFKWLNSWGKGFGRDGWAWLPLKGITKTPAFEAYTVKAVCDDPLAEHLVPQIIV